MSFRSMTHFVTFTSHVVCAAALLAVLSVASVADAVTLFWDANNSSLIGNGTWT